MYTLWPTCRFYSVRLLILEQYTIIVPGFYAQVTSLVSKIPAAECIARPIERGLLLTDYSPNETSGGIGAASGAWSWTSVGLCMYACNIYWMRQTRIR